MDMAETAIHWRNRLCACSDVAGMAAALAGALRDVAGATATGIFLLDKSGQRLILYASRPGDERDIADAPQCIDLNIPSDPLCSCIRDGIFHSMAVQPDSPEYPALALLQARGSHILAAPLMAPHGPMGAALLTADRPMLFDPLLDLLCGYGAALMDAAMQKQQDAQQLRTVQEYLTRAEEQNSARSIVTESFVFGESAAITRVKASIATVAPKDAPVLITGETGTGKEYTARAIHAAGPRRDAPFVVIDCTTIPAQLFESVLFGHKKGAFSGADNDHAGLLRNADKGTLLLDEIGDMPFELQAKLLNFLQNRTVLSVGDNTALPLDVRIISATNKNIQESMAQGTFRPDLFYRLAVYHIEIPPLRLRHEDILPLATHFLEKSCALHRRDPLALSPDAVFALNRYAYPGNIRELAGVLEKAVGTAGAEVRHLTGQHLFPDTDWGQCCGRTLAAHMEHYESAVIASALAKHDGNITEAAKELGVPRRTLGTRMQKLSLSRS